jgi:hypothetical protein
MTANEVKTLALVEVTITKEKEDEYSIPMDISDIINICRVYNNLGWQIQQQVENILEVGVEESIKSGFVKKDALPHVKMFLQAIISNPYFGDAVSQAHDCLRLIKEHEDQYKKVTAFVIN